MKKNAIMTIDFAIDARREGRPAIEAIRDGALVRFRPITMTTLAAIAGALPIALGFGAGGVARQPLGLSVVGGLVLSQLVTLYLTPVLSSSSPGLRPAWAGRSPVRSGGAARVGLLARGRDGLEGAQREIEAAGGRALAVPTDVADAEQVEAATQAVEETFGPIDVYLGTVYGTLAALRRMLPRDHGVIVQVGSVLAYRAIPLQAAYCGAKHAIQGFTEALRSELLHDKSRVRVAMVQLPALNTPQFGWVKTRLPRKPQPVPPIYQPEVAAEVILWAADEDRWKCGSGAPPCRRSSRTR